MSTEQVGRVVVWFSRGAASACAAKLAVQKYPPINWPGRLFIVYCNTASSENADGDRFHAQVEQWIGHPITKISSRKYESVDEVFEGERYMSGVKGAKCTTEMKKVPRLRFQRPDDLHVFGYTVDEAKRIARFEQNNPELYLDWILRDAFVRKADCHRMLREAGITEPEMYRLGFEHNNCWGCVKSKSPAYWQRTAKHNPEVFARRVRQSRALGVRLVEVKGVRIFLDELDLSKRYKGGDGDIDCGPYCIDGANQDERL
jgi:hypothetical protein